MRLTGLRESTIKLGSRHIGAPSVALIGAAAAFVSIVAILYASVTLSRYSAGMVRDVCTESQPPSGAYAVTLCITNPLDQTTFSGEIQVSLRATVAGKNVGLHQFMYMLDDEPIPVEAFDDGSFVLETRHFGDGKHLLQVFALMADGYVSRPVSIEVTFDNGVAQAFAPASPTDEPTAKAVPSETASAASSLVPATPARRPVVTRVAKAAAPRTPTITPVPTELPDTSGISNTTDTYLGDYSPQFQDVGDGSGSCFGNIDGHITSNGAPVADVWVHMLDRANSSTDLSPTDGAGYYVFPGLEDGSYTISVDVPSGYSAAVTAASVTISSCSNPTQDFVLTTNATLPTSTSATPTATSTVRVTVTGTVGATASLASTIPAVVGTPTVAPTAAASATATATRTPTAQAEATATQTLSPTPTLRPTRTPTRKPSATPIPTPTRSQPEPTEANARSGDIVTLAPVADAYVSPRDPSTNYGTAPVLRIDGSPAISGYLKFNVHGLVGAIKSATLRVYAYSSSGAGFAVRSVGDGSWSETGITFANAPAISAAATGSSGSTAGDAWLSVNVTPLVTGNGSVSFALTTTGAQINLASRESRGNAPQLVIVMQ